MLNLQNARKYVPTPRFETLPLVQVARTEDIIREVARCCEADQSQTSKLAYHLKSTNTLETCKNIYNFLRNNVQYVADDIKKMVVKPPSRLLYDGFGDCKSFSIFIVTVLNNLGIKCFLRFVGYNQDREPTHVYVVAIDEQNNSILIDACIDKFNYELPYNPKTKKDVATSIVKMNGVQGAGYAEYDSYIMCPSCGGHKNVGIGFGPNTYELANSNPTVGINWQNVSGIVDIVRSGVGVVQDIKNIFGGNNPVTPVNNVSDAEIVRMQQELLAKERANNQPPADNTMLYVGGAFVLFMLLNQNSKKKK